MNDGVRRAAVAALTGLAGSADRRDRADAGRALASFAEMPEARSPLVRLVLDPADTLVTRVTAEALLRRGDSAGLATVASALSAADPNQGDWIHAAVRDVFMVSSRDRDAAMRECDRLRQDPDDTVRRGVDELIAALAEIDPILRPAP